MDAMTFFIITQAVLWPLVIFFLWADVKSDREWRARLSDRHYVSGSCPPSPGQDPAHQEKP